VEGLVSSKLSFLQGNLFFYASSYLSSIIIFVYLNSFINIYI
jgi:hypothetical protein